MVHRSCHDETCSFYDAELWRGILLDSRLTLRWVVHFLGILDWFCIGLACAQYLSYVQQETRLLATTSTRSKTERAVSSSEELSNSEGHAPMKSFLDRMRGATNPVESTPSSTLATHPAPDTQKVVKSDEEWKKQLSRQEYRVLRQAGTERPWTGDLNKVHPKSGVFACRACDAPLYPASAKFDSRSGWRAFDEEIPGAVKRKRDVGVFGIRTEVICRRCDSHLGHVFEGERMTSKNSRHCINSVCLKYEPDGKK